MYMSPEQCRDPRDVDPRSDVYALGCIMFAMLCGRAPFVGDPGDVIAAHLLDAPPLPSDLGDSPLLDDVIARCLAKSPSDRYESMHEVARALAPITGIRVPTVEQPGTGNVALLTTLGSQIPRRPRRRLRALAELVSVVFALAALVASAPPLADAIVPTIVGPVVPEPTLVVELAIAMPDASPPAPRARLRTRPNDLYDSRGD